MKTLLLSICTCILFAPCSFSQVPQVFPTDSTAYWQLNYKCYDGGQDTYYTSMTFTVAGDTMIDNEQFHFLYFDEFANWHALVHLDGEQVYFRYPNGLPHGSSDDTGLFLAYDFSLAVGDTFYFPDIIAENVFVIVDNIDTIQYSDGLDRRRFHLNDTLGFYTGLMDYWVEGIGGIGGIGALTGPFYFESLFECGLAGFKFYENDELVLHEVILGDKEVELRLEIEVYPNPTQDFIRIISPELIKKLTLYNISGKMLLEQHIDLMEYELDLSESIATGMHILKIELEDQVFQMKRLIKN